MRRFLLLLANEFKLARTGLPVHVVAIVQPTILYLLMALILVHPTFDMNVSRPSTTEGQALLAAMREVGSPIGDPYINPIVVDQTEEATSQVVSVETRAGVPTAVQRFGLIDSNLVKNFRNRLTAAGLRLWNAQLEEHAVTIEQHPWLPADVPYTTYFGMALLPLATYTAACIIGGFLAAQEFEFGTVLEYRLSPVSTALILGARLIRLVLLGLLAAGFVLLAVGFVTAVWPASVLQVGFVLIPVAVIGAALGMTAGLLLRKSLPAFLFGLVSSIGTWLLGGAFGLVAGFGGLYERVSRFVPHTHAIELLFPQFFYGAKVGNPLRSAVVLTLLSMVLLALVGVVHHWRVQKRQR